MPEIISKYPDVVLTVLKESGIKCGTDIKPTILKMCPQNKFCSLPKGELCVYGLENIHTMTQINSLDLAIGLLKQGPVFSGLLILIIFLMGFIMGTKANHKRK